MKTIHETIAQMKQALEISISTVSVDFSDMTPKVTYKLAIWNTCNNMKSNFPADAIAVSKADLQAVLDDIKDSFMAAPLNNPAWKLLCDPIAKLEFILNGEVKHDR